MTYWKLRGRELANCNCEYGCNCQFGGLPDKIGCQAVFGMAIDDGFHGETDLAGLNIAYDAYKISLKGKPDRVIDGYTGDQRFFLAWAQAWRAKSREAVARQMLVTDPHSPPKYRINGIVRNFDEWYLAFAVQPGDRLYLPPDKRVRIW